jgi:hypothetical protein
LTRAADDPVTAIRNIGPALEQALARAGIHTATELREIGADAAYTRMLRTGLRPHFIGYYVLVMSLQGRPWNDCKGAKRTRFACGSTRWWPRRAGWAMPPRGSSGCWTKSAPGSGADRRDLAEHANVSPPRHRALLLPLDAPAPRVHMPAVSTPLRGRRHTKSNA